MVKFRIEKDSLGEIKVESTKLILDIPKII